MNDEITCARCGEIHKICTGHKKRKNSPDGKLHPCRKNPRRGEKQCQIHKREQNGEDNPNFKHGKYARAHYLPESLAARYDSISNAHNTDNSHLLLRKEIGTTLVRISVLEERVDSGDSLKTWERVKLAQKQIKDAIKSADANAMTEALKSMDSCIKSGSNDYRSWDELFKAQRHLKSLVESERKRLLEDKLMLSVEEVANIFSMLVKSINTEIEDQALLKRVRARLFETAKNAGMI